MKKAHVVIASGTWTRVAGTGLEVWHSAGRNMLVQRQDDGSLRLDTSGVLWLVKPAVTNGQAPTIVET
jgi:ferric-dicitrate binding protein FerR (iron transport regulator)